MTPNDVFKHIENKYGFGRLDLLKKYRGSEIIKPRQVAIYLLREECELTFDKIGLLMKRDRTTVSYNHQQARVKYSGVIYKAFNRQRWTQKEIDLLTRKYNEVTMPEMERLLPKRTKRAIAVKAFKLGIGSCKRTKVLRNKKTIKNEALRKIRNERLLLDVSLDELARRSGYHRTSIDGWERGRNKVSNVHINNMWEALTGEKTLV